MKQQDYWMVGDLGGAKFTDTVRRQTSVRPNFIQIRSRPGAVIVSGMGLTPCISPDGVMVPGTSGKRMDEAAPSTPSVQVNVSFGRPLAQKTSITVVVCGNDGTASESS